MIVEINEDTLRAQGYVKADKYDDVMITLPYVARIIGCSATAAYEYARDGWLKVDDENKMPLSEALQLSFVELKKKYLDSKSPRTCMRSKRASRVKTTKK